MRGSHWILKYGPLASFRSRYRVFLASASICIDRNL